MYVFRYAAASESGNKRAQGFELYTGVTYGLADPQPLPESLLTDQSNHLWKVELPRYLKEGVHTAKVYTTDKYGHQYTDFKVFEIMDKRPAPLFQIQAS